MDVRLPDGTVVKNVPEGITRAELMARVNKARGVEEEPTQAAVPATAQASADAAERIAGSRGGRFLLGAGQLLAGPFQLGANVGDWVAEKAGLDPTVGKAVNEWQQRLEDMKRGGMAAHGAEGVDIAGLLGTVAGGAGAMKSIPQVATAFSKIGQGAGIGAGFGAATPVTDGGDDFFATKGSQVAAGTFLGGAIPAAMVGGKAAGGALKDVADLILPGGARRIADKFQRAAVGGKEHIDRVVEALRNARELVPGSKPTAAQAVVGVPSGSPIVAHQRITAQTPGGISAQFGQRAMDQKAAREAAMTSLNETTRPLREDALAAANKGGVSVRAVLKGADDISDKPGIRASDVVQKTIASIKAKIEGVAGKDGIVDARDLYTIRKEIGNTIKSHAKETSNWDKKLASGLERDIQKAIDDAIESAGGEGWKGYLAKYAAGRQAITADVSRAKAAYKPEQSTSLAGGQNVAEETRTHIPQLLSRPAMIVNAIMRRLGYAIEPRVDAIIANRYLNPEVLADALEGGTKSQRQQVVEELLRKYGRAATIGGPATLAAEQQ